MTVTTVRMRLDFVEAVGRLKTLGKCKLLSKVKWKLLFTDVHFNCLTKFIEISKAFGKHKFRDNSLRGINTHPNYLVE